MTASERVEANGVHEGRRLRQPLGGRAEASGALLKRPSQGKVREQRLSEGRSRRWLHIRRGAGLLLQQDAPDAPSPRGGACASSSTSCSNVMVGTSEDGRKRRF